MSFGRPLPRFSPCGRLFSGLPKFIKHTWWKIGGDNIKFWAYWCWELIFFNHNFKICLITREYNLPIHTILWNVPFFIRNLNFKILKIMKFFLLEIDVFSFIFWWFHTRFSQLWIIYNWIFFQHRVSLRLLRSSPFFSAQLIWMINYLLKLKSLFG